MMSCQDDKSGRAAAGVGDFVVVRAAFVVEHAGILGPEFSAR
jgi:hypothetical protein